MSAGIRYFKQGEIETEDGARIHYEVHGEGGPPIVMCDGLGCDGFAWKYLLPEIQQRHQVIRWHYRGHGKSGVPRDLNRIGIDYTCQDLSLVLDTVGVKQAVVFGHSMGVQVALEAHRCMGDRVLGLVLLCGSYGNPLDTLHDVPYFRSVFPYLKRLVEKFPGGSAFVTGTVMGLDLAAEYALTVELNRALCKKEDLKPYFAHLAKMSPVVFVRTLESLASHSAWDHLLDVNVPTVVVGGEQDKFTPVWLSRRMAATIPGAEYFVIPGGSHTATLERPEMVSEIVNRYLDQHFRRQEPKRARG